MSVEELQNNVRAWIIVAQGAVEIGGDVAGVRNEAVDNIVRLRAAGEIYPTSSPSVVCGHWHAMVSGSILHL